MIIIIFKKNRVTIHQNSLVVVIHNRIELRTERMNSLRMKTICH